MLHPSIFQWSILLLLKRVKRCVGVLALISAEKAPGPDSYIGAFYKSSWGLIKEDVPQAINYFYNRHDQHFNLLNNAHIVLLPKKDDAVSVGDYMPISLSHI